MRRFALTFSIFLFTFVILVMGSAEAISQIELQTLGQAGTSSSSGSKPTKRLRRNVVVGSLDALETRKIARARRGTIVIVANPFPEDPDSNVEALLFVKASNRRGDFTGPFRLLKPGASLDLGGDPTNSASIILQDSAGVNHVIAVNEQGFLTVDGSLIVGPPGASGPPGAAGTTVNGAGLANTTLSNLAVTAINASLLPNADAVFDLGSPTRRWRDGYFSNGTVLIDDFQISFNTGSRQAVFTIDGRSFTFDNGGALSLGSNGNLLGLDSVRIGAQTLTDNGGLLFVNNQQILLVNGGILSSNTVNSSTIVNNSIELADINGASLATAFTNRNLSNLQATSINQSLIANAHDSLSLGSDLLRWSDLFVATGSVHIGNNGDEAVISYNNGTSIMGFDPDGDGVNEMRLSDNGDLFITRNVTSSGEFFGTLNGAFLGTITNATNFTGNLNGDVMGTQTATQIGMGRVGAPELAQNAITNGNIIDGSILGIDLQAATLTATQLAADSVGESEIAANAVRNGEVLDRSLIGADLALGTITSMELAQNSITNGNIIDGSILGIDLQAATITATQLAAASVGESEIAANAVRNGEVLDRSLIGADLAIGTVTGTEILDGSIEAVDINGASLAGLAANRTLSNLNATSINQSLIANAHNTFDLGSDLVRWRDLYVAPGSIHIGNNGEEAILRYVNGTQLLAFDTDGDGTREFTMSGPGNFDMFGALTNATSLTAATVTGTAITGTSITATGQFFGTLNGNALTSTTATNFSGNLNGDVMGTQTATQIGVGRVGESEIAANAVRNGEVLDRSLIGADLALGAITSMELAQNAITNGNIIDGSILGADLQAATITATQLAADSVGESEIAANAVRNGEVLDRSLIGADLALGAITSMELAQNAITNGNIIDGSILGADLQAATITATQLAADSVGESEIAANAVRNGEVLDRSLIGADLALGAITSMELAQNSITNGNIIDGSILGADLQAATITATQLAADSVGESEIAANAVRNGEVLDRSLIGADLVIGTVTGTEIADGTIEAVDVNGAGLQTLFANRTLSNLNATSINQSLIANAHNTFALGSDLVRWSELFVSNGSVHVGFNGDEAVVGYDSGTNELTIDQGLRVAGATNLVGSLRLQSGNPGNGRVLVTDVNGNSRWENVSALTGGGGSDDWVVSGSNVVLNQNGAALPNGNALNALGSDLRRWSDLFVTGSSIHIGSNGQEAILGYVNGTQLLVFDTDGDGTREFTMSGPGNFDMFGALTNATSLTAATITGTTMTGTNITATGEFFGTLNGNALTATTATTATNFSGNLNGDVMGTQTATQIGVGRVGAPELAQNAITNGNIIDGSILGADLQGDTVTAAQIAADGVGESEIAANAVRNGEVLDRSLIGADLAIGAVTTTEIADGTIEAIDINGASLASLSANRTLSNLNATSINQSLIANAHNTLDLGSDLVRWRDLYVAPGSIHVGNNGEEAIIGYVNGTQLLVFDTDGDGTREFTMSGPGNFDMFGALTNATSLTAATVTGTNITATSEFFGALNGNALTATTSTIATNFSGNLNGDVMGTQTATQIGVGRVGAPELAQNAITNGNIIDASILGADLQGDTITTAQIAADGVGESEIAANAVRNGEVLDRSLIGADLAIGAVTTTEIADGTIEAIDINGASLASLSANRTLSNLNATSINQSLIANAHNTLDLGSDLIRWRDLYVAPGSIHVGNNGEEAIIGYVNGTQLLVFDTDGDGTREFTMSGPGNFDMFGALTNATSLTAATITGTNITATSEFFGALNGNALTATTATTATNFSGNLNGDVMGTQTATQIGVGRVGAPELAQNAITNGNIIDASILGADLQGDTVTAAQIAADGVGESEIAANAVRNGEVLDRSLIGADLAIGAVTTTEIADGTIEAIDVNGAGLQLLFANRTLSNLNATSINQALVPSTNNSFALGSDAVRWSELFVSNGSVQIGVSGDEVTLSYDTGSNTFMIDRDTALAAADLHVRDGSLLVSGDVGATPVSGNGRRLMYSSAKSAFRVGHVLGTQWDDANIGTSSFVGGGQNSTASASFSATLGGSGGTASGNSSIIVGGQNSTATQQGAISIGGGTNRAQGHSSIAMGSNNANARAINSVAIGRNVDARGNGSMIIGLGLVNDEIINTTANSLMIGMNGNGAALFVGPAPGGQTTGNIGIGGLTTPTEKLDVLGNIAVSGTVDGVDIAQFFSNVNGLNLSSGKADANLGNLTATSINQSLIANAHNTFDLGSDLVRWRDLYVAPGSIHIGNNGEEAILGYVNGMQLLVFDTDGDGTREFTMSGPGNFDMFGALTNATSLTAATITGTNITATSEFFGALNGNALTATTATNFSGNLNGDVIGTQTATQIGVGRVGASELAQNAITNGNIIDGSILGADLQGDTVTAAQIAADGVGESEIAANAVRNGEVLDRSLIGADLAIGTVTGTEILDGSIEAVDINGASLAGLAANRTLSNLNATSVNQSLIANAHNTLDLGSDLVRWRDGYFSNGSIHVGFNGDEAIIGYDSGSNELTIDQGLEVAGATNLVGALRIQSGTPANGRVLTTDVNGNSRWEDLNALTGNAISDDWAVISNNLVMKQSGNALPNGHNLNALGSDLVRWSDLFVSNGSLHVGFNGNEAAIGYDSGSNEVTIDQGLEVAGATNLAGTLRIQGGTPANGRILITDANGNTRWEDTSVITGASVGWADDGAVVRLITETDSVGIGTRNITNGEALAIGNGGILVSGEFAGSPSNIPLGIGTRMFWSPGRNIFRASRGTIAANYDSEADFGSNSAAFNTNTRAPGDSSFAIGTNTNAFAANAFAGGSQSMVSGVNGFAFGTTANALAADSVAMGTTPVAAGISSIAFGDANALGFESIAIGDDALANGTDAVALGTNMQAFANNSVAIGAATLVNPIAVHRAGISMAVSTSAQNGTAMFIGPNDTVNGTGFVGVGTDMPSSRLHVLGDSLFQGNIRITGGNPANGSVLLTDANGNARWESLSALGATPDWIVSGNNVILNQIGDALPNGDALNSLGTGLRRWKDLFVSNGSIHVGMNGDEAVITYELGENQLRIDQDTTFASQIGVGTNNLDNGQAIHTSGGSILFGGGVGSVPASAAGTRMFWAPGKAALRAGSVTGTQWDDASVGALSVALGRNTTASGSDSFAIGDTATATGTESVAVGNLATASNTGAAAFGFGANASGSQAVALGSGATSSNVRSVALAFSTASGIDSLAAASGTATGRNATAIGNSAFAAGEDSLVLGRDANTTSAGVRAIALGENTSANNRNSIVIGEGLGQTDLMTNPQQGTLMVGFGGNGATLFVNRTPAGQTSGQVGIGTDSTAAKLHIQGDIRITGGNPANGSVLTTDANGAARWETISALTGNSISDDWAVINNNLVMKQSGDALPNGHNLNSLGSDLVRWSELFVSNGSVHIGFNGDEATFSYESGTNQVRIDQDTTFASQVGVGTNNLDNGVALNVAGGSILSAGTTGATPTSGSGTRFMWIPASRALRAGSVTGTQWDNANVGINSVALGENTTASGQASFAFGGDSTASGADAIAIGDDASATMLGSVAIGDAASATGQQASAFGNAASATNTRATAVGNTASATGVDSWASTLATASGIRSVAIGNASSASGVDSLALSGGTTNSLGVDAIAMGENTLASNDNAIVIGEGASATDFLNNNLQGTLMVGFAGNGATLFVNRTPAGQTSGQVGIGTSSTAAKLHVQGDIRITGGNPANGRVLISDANGTSRWENSSVIAAASTGWVDDGAIVRLNQVADSVSIGSPDNIQNGEILAATNGTVLFGGVFGQDGNLPLMSGPDRFSHMLWSPGRAVFRAYRVTNSTSADSPDDFGLHSAAFGFGSQASGDQSFAAGNGVFARGDNATAFGNSNEANGVGSFVVGSGSDSIGQFSIAMGSLALANGQSSVAIGPSANAFGLNSVAIGPSARTDDFNSVAIGQNSRAGDSTDFVFGSGLRTTSAAGGMLFGLGGAANTIVMPANGIAFGINAGTNNGIGLFIEPNNTDANGTSFIGIGTSNPVEKLDVRGSIQALGGNLIVNGGNMITTGTITGGNISSSGNIAVTGTVDGVDIAQFFSDTNGLNLSTSKADTNLNNLTATSINQDLIASAHNTRALGSDLVRWSELFVSNGSIHVGFNGDEAVIGYDSGDNELTLDRGLDVTGNIVVSGTVDSVDVGNFFAQVNGLNLTTSKADTNLNNLTATSINQSLIPSTNNSVALGTNLVRWSELYVSNGSIHLGFNGDEAEIGYSSGTNEVTVDQNLEVSGTTQLVGALQIQNGAPSNGRVLVTDDNGNSRWENAAAVVGNAVGWTDDGTTVRLTTATDNVGIGTTDTTNGRKLHVADGSFMVSGTTGQTPEQGAGTRMMFIPTKGALRAGQVTGTQWNEPNIGVNGSVAIGFDNTAGGASSAVFGARNNASGMHGFATGFFNTASGTDSFVAGRSSTASNTGSIAMGYGAVATNFNSVAIGNGASATGFSAVAIGDDASATSTRSITMSTGPGAFTTATGSILMGQNLRANGSNAIVIGRGVDSTNVMQTSADTFGVGFNTTGPTLMVEAGSGVGTVGQVGIGTINANATFDVRGSAIFNEDGGDNDFRVESDSDPNFFFANAGTNSIQIRDAAVGGSMSGALNINSEFLDNFDDASPLLKLLNNNGDAHIGFHVLGLHRWSMGVDRGGLSGSQFKISNSSNFDNGAVLIIEPNGTFVNNPNQNTLGDFRVATTGVNAFINVDSSQNKMVINRPFGLVPTTAEVELNGTVLIRGGQPANGRILMSDAVGLARWENPSAILDSNWTGAVNDVTFARTGNVLPNSNGANDIGTSANRWASLYLTNGTLHIGNSTQEATVTFNFDSSNGTLMVDKPIRANNGVQFAADSNQPTCNSNSLGTMRYNSTACRMEFCDGVTYVPVPGQESKRVFVTSTGNSGTGDLVARAGALTPAAYTGIDGIGAADFICQNLADGAGLGGRWIAIISDDNTDARDRVSNIKTMTELSGTSINACNLWDGTIGSNFDIDENGNTAPTDNVWTGTTSAGVSEGSNCSNWTNGTVGASGHVGITNSTTASWINSTDNLCSNNRRLYCVEQ